MKIFFTIGGLSGSGGIDRVVAILSDYFCKCGNDVVIHLIGARFDFSTRANIVYYVGNNRCRLTKIISEFLCILKIRKVIERENPDVIYNTCWAVPFFGFLKKGKILSAIHWDPRKELKHVNWKLRFLTRFLRFSAATVVPTQSLKGVLEKQFRFKNVIAIPNPVDFSAISNQLNALTLLDSLLGSSYILAVGRLDVDKNFALLIRAFALTAAKNKVELLIIGEGVLREELQVLISSIKLDSRVHLLGAQSNVFAYMAHCLFFVSSSSVETFSMVLAEALACGVAVISTDIDGPRDFISHGENGLLVKNNGLREMAEAIDKLYFDVQLRNKLASSAKKSVAKLSIENIALLYQKVFDNIYFDNCTL